MAAKNIDSIRPLYANQNDLNSDESIAAAFVADTLALLMTLGLALGAGTGCYINAKVPLDTNLDRTQLGDKVGRSSVTGVFWLFAWGDGGIQAAAIDGELTTIHHADLEIYLILLGLYVRRTTIVYGE